MLTDWQSDELSRCCAENSCFAKYRSRANGFTVSLTLEHPCAAPFAGASWRVSGSVKPPKSANAKGIAVCRNIKTLHNFAPPATEDEIRASAIQFVRKLSGFTHPSKANEAAFDAAVESVSEAARTLLSNLVTNAPPRDREIEAEKARERSKLRFARS